MLLKHSLKVLVLRELTKHSQLSFSDLMVYTQATSGNLGKALERLEAAQYITRQKVVEIRSTVSMYRMTVKGNHQYSLYVSELKK
jgi:DNA-binding MarR family transcriptional regulator